MASGKRFSFKLSALLLWRLALAASFISCVVMAVLLWLSGGAETEKAMDDGRRLVITLETGQIEGRQITSELPAPTLEPPKETPPAETPPEAQPPVEPLPEAIPPAEVAPPVEEPPPAEAPPAEVAPPTEMPPTETPATPPEVSLPEQPPVAEAPKEEPVAPVPLTYDQLPVTPQPKGQSAAPLALPATAPTPPLAGDTLPEIVPSDKKPADINSLLAESVKEGTVPRIAADGTRAWKYYAKPYTKDSRKPMIAIVVTGLGQNKKVTQYAIALPENVTLAFSPYAPQVEQWSKSARLAGHESMLELPLEPADYPATDPGPYGLMLGKGSQDNEAHLRWLMARMPTSVGFVTPRNEKFSSSTEDFKLLLQSLANRGLMLVIAKDPAREEIKGLLNESTIPNIIADQPIDEELSPSLIQARLYALEQLAHKKGYAVGIAGSYPLTIAELQAWIKQLEAKGVVLVPLSTIAKLDYS